MAVRTQLNEKSFGTTMDSILVEKLFEEKLFENL